jgi:hypothetical protein
LHFFIKTCVLGGAIIPDMLYSVIKRTRKHSQVSSIYSKFCTEVGHGKKNYFSRNYSVAIKVGFFLFILRGPKLEFFLEFQAWWTFKCRKYKNNIPKLHKTCKIMQIQNGRKIQYGGFFAKNMIDFFVVQPLNEIF